MNRSIRHGLWFDIHSQEEFDQVRAYGDLKNKHFQARVQKGRYVGPGQYMLLQYDQPCPRGCCYDDVNELLSSEEVAAEVKEQIDELQALLERAEPKRTDDRTDGADEGTSN